MAGTFAVSYFEAVDSKLFLSRRIKLGCDMTRLKTHLKVFGIAIVFGMIAYGFMHLGMAVHRVFL